MFNDIYPGYVPFNLQNIFDGTRAPSAVKNNSVAYAFWYKALYQRLCSIIEFKNLPDNWERAKDFLEACLFSRGFVVVFDSRNFGVSFQPASLNGMDFYYQPVEAIVSNPKLSKTFEIGKDCELIRLTNDYYGVLDIVSYYASKLANMDGALDMNVINSKFAYVLGAKNKTAGQAIKMIFDKINKGEPLVVYDKTITETASGEDPFTFIDRGALKNGYIVTDLLNDMQTIINSFDSEIGIPTAPAEKKERMITDEVNSKQADATARVKLWSECLENSLKVVNGHFGTNIDFELRFAEEVNINGLVNSNAIGAQSGL